MSWDGDSYRLGGGEGINMLTKEKEMSMQSVTLKDLKQVWAEGEFPPFDRFSPERAVYLTAVKLAMTNLEAVAFFMLQQGKGAVYVPEDRQSFQWNGKRFDMGDWIVLEWIEEGGLRWAQFRHVTEDEAQTYGLGQ